MRPLPLAAALLLITGLHLPVQAQVIRCTDARTGQVTYTDGNCNGGASAREVEARKTPEELQTERQLAAEALERKHQRLQAEALLAETEARRNAERDRERARAAQAAAPQPQDYARSPDCLRARRDMEYVIRTTSVGIYEDQLRMEATQRQVDLACLGPQGYADVERNRAANQPKIVVVPTGRGVHNPAPPPPPRYLTQCGDWRCTDNQGTVYPKTGPGRFPGPGGVCRSNGGQAPC